MGKTSIEWTDASWNPVVGCTEVSPGCANCYAARLASTRLRNTTQYKGLSILRDGRLEDAACAAGIRDVRSHWTGEVRFLPERLEEPLHWRKPRRIFVCDMGDLFHESVSWEWLDKIWLVMARAKQHTFQVLTKRATRMQEYLSDIHKPLLPNLWLGVSVENQHFAVQRIPDLLTTPAAVHFISAEPLLNEIRIAPYLPKPVTKHGAENAPAYIKWVICGGESGPGARAMHPDWARSLRDQCQAAGVPFFFKQWGEYVAPEQNVCALHSSGAHHYVSDGHVHSEGCPNAKQFVVKVGKKAAGRLLDGREWNEFPRSAS